MKLKIDKREIWRAKDELTRLKTFSARMHYGFDKGIEFTLKQLKKDKKKFKCVVLYRERQNSNELRQSYHKGFTKDEALRDFFDKVGEKGINILWLNDND